MRMGSWEQGLPFIINKKGQRLKQNSHPRLTLVTDKHLSDKDLPIYQFLHQVPSWILDKIKHYHHMQFLLLQLLSINKNARELFEHSPTILWLLVIEIQNNHYSEATLNKLLNQKRQVILASLYQLSTPEQIKFINKISFYMGGIKEFNRIRQVIMSYDIIKAFRHWDNIPVQVLFIIDQYPKLLGTQLLKNAFSGEYHNYINSILEFKETYGLLLDIERMSEILQLNEVASPNNRQYKKLKNKTAVKKMHDKMVDKINKDPLLKTEYGIGFPKPPIQGNDTIIHIDNAYELKTEGRELCHCVGSYTDLARQGHSAYYKIMTPERGTVEIYLQGEKYIISQFKLAHNKNPSKQSIAIVKQWLKEGNK
jgi:hypothetical protein